MTAHTFAFPIHHSRMLAIVVKELRDDGYRGDRNMSDRVGLGIKSMVFLTIFSCQEGKLTQEKSCNHLN